jgi:uncharacterized membrane protein YeiB
VLLTITFWINLKFLTMFISLVGAGAVAVSRYGSGSDQMMRLLAAPASQH